jgi:hypothetical protein
MECENAGEVPTEKKAELAKSFRKLAALLDEAWLGDGEFDASVQLDVRNLCHVIARDLEHGCPCLMLDLCDLLNEEAQRKMGPMEATPQGKRMMFRVINGGKDNHVEAALAALRDKKEETDAKSV